MFLWYKTQAWTLDLNFIILSDLRHDTLLSERAGLFFLEAIVRAEAGKYWKNGKIPSVGHQPVQSLND